MGVVKLVKKLGEMLLNFLFPIYFFHKNKITHHTFNFFPTLHLLFSHPKLALYLVSFLDAIESFCFLYLQVTKNHLIPNYCIGLGHQLVVYQTQEAISLSFNYNIEILT